MAIGSNMCCLLWSQVEVSFKVLNVHCTRSSEQVLMSVINGSTWGLALEDKIPPSHAFWCESAHSLPIKFPCKSCCSKCYSCVV